MCGTDGSSGTFTPYWDVPADECERMCDNPDNKCETRVMCNEHMNDLQL